MRPLQHLLSFFKCVFYVSNVFSAGISNIPTVIQRTPMSDDQRHVKKDSETINKNASNSMNKTRGQSKLSTF